MLVNQGIKKELTLYGKKIAEKGLVVAGGGNISAREGDIIYLSPSGFALDEINEDQWVKMELATGKVINSNKLKPTCEIKMHLMCYRVRGDIRAVIHTHPPYVIGVISTGTKIKPMFPDYVTCLGKEVPLLPYIIPSGEKLAEVVGKVISKYNVISLKNHGALTVGGNLKEAFYRSIVLEEAAKILFISKTVGTPAILTPYEVKEIDDLTAEAYRRRLLKDV
ncbi:class II aldolase/adducin family protein [Candidatus Aerophobetes bacterium]|nr:class II aldolase/adducin family protein [Candidatus Aerophobetes bacterium]